jgi:hypothetical protein
LTPLPATLKSAITQIAMTSGFGDVKMRFNVGNLLTIGRKSD